MTDVPRCQAYEGRRKSGAPRRCGRPIQFVTGGVYEGWEHVEPYGGHMVTPDPEWFVDHVNKRVVPTPTEEGEQDG